MFNFDEDPIYFTDNNYTTTTETPTVYVKNLSYTLKEGEYFYYTDKNKSDIAYYGSGTKITRTLNTPDIFKFVTDNTVSTEEISTRGLNAAIPWRAFDLSKSGSTDKKLVFTEYQYINLTKDDILSKIDCSNKLSNS
jgi:hypothetical protein